LIPKTGYLLSVSKILFKTNSQPSKILINFIFILAKFSIYIAKLLNNKKMSFLNYDVQSPPTFLTKYQFKKLSQIYIPEILALSYDLNKKIHLKNLMIFLFLESGKNLLYSEATSKFENEINKQIFRKSFFSFEINEYDSKIRGLFDIIFDINVFKKGDLALIIKGMNRKKIIKIEKFLNDFVIFDISKNENPKIEKLKKKNKAFEILSENNFEGKSRLDNIRIFNKEKKAKKSFPPDNEKKIPYSTSKNYSKLGEDFSLGKTFFCKEDKSVKIFVELKNNLLKFMNIDGTYEIFTPKNVKKFLIPQSEEKNLTFDFHGNIFLRGDLVKVISGVFSGNKGRVIYINRNKVIVDCAEMKSNFSFIILNPTQISFLCKKYRYQEISLEPVISPKSFSPSKLHQNNLELSGINNTKKDIESFSREKIVNISSENLNLKKYI
jgi:hypothetical protein